MAGDADESCQADSFCLDECFNGSFRAEYLLNVSFGPDVVNLPQVQMIRFHVHQRLGKMSQSPLLSRACDLLVRNISLRLSLNAWP